MHIKEKKEMYNKEAFVRYQKALNVDYAYNLPRYGTGTHQPCVRLQECWFKG